MKDLYTYKNYRKYLKDYHKLNKKLDTSFSYRKFAESAGMKTNSYIIEIVNGIKKLSLNTAFRVATSLGLAGNQISYFMSMVAHNDCIDRKERKYHKGMMDYYRG